VKRFIIVAIIVIIVLAYLVTYRVRFTETAVKTTFGQASSQPVDEPGLKFIIPYVQSVVKYDKRARYLESRPETVQTRDARQVVVTSYVTWKVSDPKLFFQKFSNKGERASSHYRGAEGVLSDQLRSAMGQVSQFRFDELLSSSDAGSKLGECEQKILASLEGGTSSTSSDETLESKYGIKPIAVGIIGMELPEETTARVFDAMQTNRSRIANDEVSQGKAIAATIRSTAQADADTILKFAENRAQVIRAKGDAEAQRFQQELAKQPELAVFIRNMDLMKEVFGNNRVTLMLPAGPRGWPGFELFQPGFMDELKSGKLAPFDMRRVPTPTKTGNAGDAAPAPAPSSDSNATAQGNKR
jgi:membrane protease subunit HflC